MIELESLECEYCGKVYDFSDYVDVYKRNDGSFICERCLDKSEE